MPTVPGLKFKQANKAIAGADNALLAAAKNSAENALQDAKREKEQDIVVAKESDDSAKELSIFTDMAMK